MEAILYSLVIAIVFSFYVYFLNERNKMKGVYILRLPHYYFFGNAILILMILIWDDEKVPMILLVNLVFFISYTFYYFANKISEKPDFKNISSADTDNFNQETERNSRVLDKMIPEMCPHCKNPNSKRVRLCDWCGNQIC